MFPITRLFESEQAASEAIEKLVAGDVARGNITVVRTQRPGAEEGAEAPAGPGAAEKIDALIERGFAMKGHRKGLIEALGKGRTVVSVVPIFGQGSFVEATLDGSGAVDTDVVPDYLPDDPAPFSSALGLPVLTDGKSKLTLVRFDKNRSFGLGLLSKRATPLSSLFGLKILSASKGSIAKGSAVERMSGNPAPLSSMFGLKLLSKGSRSGGSRESVKRMSGNAAPFSAFLGLSVLSRDK